MGPFLTVQLDRRSRQSLQRQLYAALRRAILEGRLGPGARLPATRLLAEDLGISRNTVAAAFEQLWAEGYVEGRVGSGTYVASKLPEDLLAVCGRQASERVPFPKTLKPSERGRMLAAIPAALRGGHEAPRPFNPGLAALDRFPRELWARLSARLVRRAPAALLTYGDPAGYLPLRRAIAEYVRAARGVRAEADQIIVTAGSQQGLDLAARVLLDVHDTAWVEDPGYLGARGALLAAGIRSAAIPVDQEGINVDEGLKRAPSARLACVTPSHQYPLGVTMSLPRRMRLLEWARRNRAWIVEDDYDSEFRYSGHPLAALQGLDTAGRVLYMGTFSKVLFPGLRLGYLVCPPPLVDAFVSARALADRHPPGIEQAITAEFIAEGHFARHVRRMRALYAERQQELLRATERELAGLLEVRSAAAGMHLNGWLADSASDQDVSARAAAAGIIAPALSSYVIHARIRPGLRLGYAAFSERQIREGVRKLAIVLHSGIASVQSRSRRLPRVLQTNAMHPSSVTTA